MRIKKNNINLILLLIFAFVVFVGFGIRSFKNIRLKTSLTKNYSNPKTPTGSRLDKLFLENNKQYTNEKLGFYFIYPDTWQETDLGSTKSKYELISLTTNIDSGLTMDSPLPPGPPQYYTISVQRLFDNDIQNYFQKVSKPKGKLDKFSINNLDGFKTLDIPGGIYNTMVYFIKTKSGEYVSFSFWPYPETEGALLTSRGINLKNYQDFEASIIQVLSTFRFLDENEISWEDAIKKIKNCEIRQTMQTHDLKVELTSTEGITYKTTEPEIDEISKIEQSVAKTCPPILSASE